MVGFVASVAGFNTLRSSSAPFIFERMVDLDLCCFDLKEQIELGYFRRTHVISLFGKTQKQRTDFSYCGCTSLGKHKADRFHVSQFTPSLKHAGNVVIATSVMRECCQNVLFTPVHLSMEQVQHGLAALKRRKVTRAEVRNFIAPHLPSSHHRAAVHDLDSDLFDVVDVLTAMGRAEPTNFFSLGRFAGLLLTTAAGIALPRTRDCPADLTLEAA